MHTDCRSSATEEAHDKSGEPDHAKDLPVAAPTGRSNKNVAKALQTMKDTPCLSPEEQCRALGKTPKPKGRPSNKHAKAKATPKPKVAAKSKPKAKAKAGNRKRKALKAPETDDNAAWEEGHAMEEYEQDTYWDWGADDAGYAYEQDGPDLDWDSQSAPKKESSKTRKPGGKGKGKTGKAKEHQRKHPASSSSSSRKPKASKACKESGQATGSSSSKPKASKAPRKTKTKKTNETHDNDPATLERKARLSRKSCASKKARREALNAGKTPEEAKAAAAQAPWLPVMCVCARCVPDLRFATFRNGSLYVMCCASFLKQTMQSYTLS